MSTTTTGHELREAEQALIKVLASTGAPYTPSTLLADARAAAATLPAQDLSLALWGLLGSGKVTRRIDNTVELSAAPAELNLLECGAEDTHRNRAAIRAAAEIRALRAERDTLLAALKDCAEFWMNETPVYPGSEAAHAALAAIGRALDARAEGRGE